MQSNHFVSLRPVTLFNTLIFKPGLALRPDFYILHGFRAVALNQALTIERWWKHNGQTL